MGLGIPPLKFQIVLESNPLKSTMLLGRLGVVLDKCFPPISMDAIFFAIRDVSSTMLCSHFSRIWSMSSEVHK